MPNLKAILVAVLKRAACLFVRSRLDGAVPPPSNFTPPPVITPTVGRVVWFYPLGHRATDQPLAAIVTEVLNDRCVNLAVFERSGNPMSDPPRLITLLQGDDVGPEGGAFCQWMPFQKGQAAKTEALAKQLAAKA